MLPRTWCGGLMSCGYPSSKQSARLARPQMAQPAIPSLSPTAALPHCSCCRTMPCLLKSSKSSLAAAHSFSNPPARPRARAYSLSTSSARSSSSFKHPAAVPQQQQSPARRRCLCPVAAMAAAGHSALAGLHPFGQQWRTMVRLNYS